MKTALAVIRTRCNYSHTVLASVLGLSRQVVSAWENGKKKIIKNAFGHKLGEFDGKVTRDECGRLVGTGDLLTSLLK